MYLLFSIMHCARTPFDYGRETTGNAIVDGFVADNPDWPCGYNWTPVKECIDFTKKLTESISSPIAVGRIILARCTDEVQTFDDKKKPPIVTVENKNYDPNRLRIWFPPNAADATVQVDGETETVTLEPDRTYIDRSTKFNNLRVCWVTRHERDRVNRGKQTVENLKDAGDVISAKAEILEPHTDYLLRVKTKVTRSGDDGVTWEPTFDFTGEGYFRTESPPGMAATATEGTMAENSELEPGEKTEHYPDRGPLRNLAPYISTTIPSAGAKPVYRSYDIGVELNESYVEAMYILEGAPLALFVLDTSGTPALDTTGKQLPTINQWKELDSSQMKRLRRREEEAWTKVLQSGGCTDITDATQSPPPQGLWTRHQQLLLAPQTIYQAHISATSPLAVIPLNEDGTVMLKADGRPLVQMTIGTLNPNYAALIEQAGSDKKLITDGTVIMETSYGAKKESAPFDYILMSQQALVAAVLSTLPAFPLSRKSVYSWAFTTSRFATFLHHIQSFREEVLDIHEILGQPREDLLTREESEWLETLISSRSTGVPIGQTPESREKEAMEFERVLSVLKLEGRSLPESLEILLLRDAETSYGLLLESPEPLQWERTSLRAQHHADKAESHLLSESPLKLINIGFADSDSDLNQEYVDILLFKSLNLSGTKVQRHEKNTWVDYFQFDEDQALQEGTVVRVHTGGSSDDASPSPEIDHRYARDAGGSGNRQFDSEGVTLRLIDIHGTVLHERQFLVRYNNQSFRILRSRDDTRAFLFFPSGDKTVGEIPTGTLRLAWRYERNISSRKPDMPILRRMGSDRQETTAIDVMIRGSE